LQKRIWNNGPCPLGYTFLSMQLWWMVNSQLWISWWSHYIKKNEWINWFWASVCCKEHNGVFGSFVEKCLPCLLCVQSRIGHLDQIFLEEDGSWKKWINLVVDFMIYIWIKYYLYSFCDTWWLWTRQTFEEVLIRLPNDEY
jgi:hypothetical protein